MNALTSIRERAQATQVALPTVSIDRDVITSFEGAASREWLVTNGLGGYASGTLAGLNTRRYHGLLVASLRPPVERTLMVEKVDAIVTYRGKRYELATN